MLPNKRANVRMITTSPRVGDLPRRINRSDLSSADHLCPVHHPHRDGAVVVAPHNVRSPIAVVIASTHHAPGGIDGGDDLATTDGLESIHQPDRHVSRETPPQEIGPA